MLIVYHFFVEKRIMLKKGEGERENEIDPQVIKPLLLYRATPKSLAIQRS